MVSRPGPFCRQTPLASILTRAEYFKDALVFSGEESLVLCGENFHTATSTEEIKKVLSYEQRYGLFEAKGIRLIDYSDFSAELSVIHTVNRGIVNIVGSRDKRFIIAYKSNTALSPVEDRFPIVLENANGSQYDIFGEAMNGPNIGDQLEAALGFVAFDWAWRNFYEDIIEQ